MSNTAEMPPVQEPCRLAAPRPEWSTGPRRRASVRGREVRQFRSGNAVSETVSQY